MRKFIILYVILFSLLALSANAQGVGGKAGTGGKGGFGGGQASSSFTPGVTAVNGGCNTGGASCAASAQSVTAGNFAIACIGVAQINAVSFSVTDTDSDTFTPWSGVIIVGSNVSGECWIATMGTTDGSEVFTFHNTAAEPFMTGVDAVYTGIPTSGWDVTPAIASHVSSGCPYTMSSGTSGTTANASELGIAFFVTNGTPLSSVTGLSGWTTRVSVLSGSTVGAAIVDNILSSTQTLTATATVACSVNPASSGIVSSIK